MTTSSSPRPTAFSVGKTMRCIEKSAVGSYALQRIYPGRIRSPVFVWHKTNAVVTGGRRAYDARKEEKKEHETGFGLTLFTRYATCKLFARVRRHSVHCKRIRERIGFVAFFWFFMSTPEKTLPEEVFGIFTDAVGSPVANCTGTN